MEDFFKTLADFINRANNAINALAEKLGMLLANLAETGLILISDLVDIFLGEVDAEDAQPFGLDESVPVTLVNGEYWLITIQLFKSDTYRRRTPWAITPRHFAMVACERLTGPTGLVDTGEGYFMFSTPAQSHVEALEAVLVELNSKVRNYAGQEQQ